MKWQIKVLLTITTLFNLIYSSNLSIDEIVLKANEEFEKVSDFQAKMTVSLDVPGLRMPKKEYRAYYKRPNKFKATTKGFGVLPNTGLFTSPKDNFDNLKDLIINEDKIKIGNNQIMVSGTLIMDSLKAKFPNEYAKLSFNPIVDVVVDTSKWLINSVTSRIDTLKLLQINNYYELYENRYFKEAEEEKKEVLELMPEEEKQVADDRKLAGKKEDGNRLDQQEEEEEKTTFVPPSNLDA